MAPSQNTRSRLLCVPEAVLASQSQSSPSSTAPTASSSSAASMHLGQVLALAHPRGGSPTQYLLTPSGHLCELQSFRPSGSKFGSWFVEQRVVSDGLLYVASPMDPKFLLLPVLEKHGAARFSPLEQILAAEADGAYMPLRKCQRLELHRLCDVNDQLGDDMILYRLNPDKALAWLASKVQRTKRALVSLDSAREGQNNGIGTGFAAGFTIQTTSSSGKAAVRKDSTDLARAVTTREATRDEFRTALELVSDYLTDAWAVKLQEHCGFSEEEMKPTAGTKKRSVWEGEADAEQDTAMELTQGKRFKAAEGASGAVVPGGGGGEGGGGGGGGGVGNYGKKPAVTGPSIAQKKLAKTNLKGVKSISSFFGKKS